MLIQEDVFEHPVRAGRVRLAVYEQGGGYLVTEARDGAGSVLATLGAFDARPQALDRAAARSAELLRQRYRKVAP